MRLGLLTAPFPETPLTDVVEWTAANGFESIEIACWPRATGPTRRYAGTSHIDVANLTADAARDLAAQIRASGLTISGLRPASGCPVCTTRGRARLDSS